MRRARVSPKLSRPLSSPVALPGLRRAFSPARIQHGPEIAERGGTEVSDGRQLVPQAFSDEVR